MNCNDFEQWLHDYLDHDLEPGRVAAMEAHQQACDRCRQHLDGERNLRGALRRLPVAEPSAAFFDRAVQQASRRQRMRRTRQGIGAALAAGLVLAVAVNTLFDIGQRPATTPGAAVLSAQQPVVQLALNEKRDVRLVFDAATELNAAQVTLRLPAQVRVAGYPDRQQLSWATRLKRGKNLLVLPVSALRFGHGTLVAEIAHNGNTRAFTVDLDVTGQQQSIRALTETQAV